MRKRSPPHGLRIDWSGRARTEKKEGRRRAPGGQRPGPLVAARSTPPRCPAPRGPPARRRGPAAPSSNPCSAARTESSAGHSAPQPPQQQVRTEAAGGWSAAAIAPEVHPARGGDQGTSEPSYPTVCLSVRRSGMKGRVRCKQHLRAQPPAKF